MKDNCLDIGIIQAFLDGELTHDETNRVSGHIALCNACALMLAEAEDESAVVFPALEREFNTLVPTQRLWNKINDSIAAERNNAPFWQKAWAYMTLALANPSIAVAASFILVVGIVAALWMNRTPAANDIALIPKTSTTTSNPNVRNLPDPDPAPSIQTTSKIERAAFHPDDRGDRTIQANYVVKSSTAVNSAYMPGEETYVKTISSLSRSVNEQKDTVMRPSERVAYESNMAVVDDAITKMKKQVKKDPKNDSARQVLYASYQNKIDLLNSVSQKQELMASLR